MAKIDIIYGSGGGNTRLVCQTLVKYLQEFGYNVVLHNVFEYKDDVLPISDCLLLASPTYGHGVLEEGMEKFVQQFDTYSLKGQICSVVALGDTAYEKDYLLESANTLTQFIEKRGGTMILRPLKVVNSPLPFLAKGVKMWATKLHTLLTTTS